MNNDKGFTLIELLVVIAIISVLASVTLISLNVAKNRGNNAKVRSQLKSMASQAPLFSGTLGTSYIVGIGVYPTPANIQTLGGTLFNDTDLSHNGLYNLMSKLPTGTKLYYGWDGIDTTTGGKWFVAATVSVGAICIDYTGLLQSFTGNVPAVTNDFKNAFPHATNSVGVSPNYSCLID